MKIKITESQYMRLQEQKVKGDEITPGKYVVHSSNPSNRDNISVTGLQTSLGECYLIYADSNYEEDEECVPAIFATNSTKKKDMFDSTYDDDIWVIDTERAGVQWYKDAHFDGSDYKHIVTFENIPVDAVRLIYKGTGGDTWNHDDKTELTLTESNKYRLIRREADMEHRIDNQLTMAKHQNDLYFVPLDHLILHIADSVAVEMANESNLDGDEYIIFRNQIKQYFRSIFYGHIKEFWETNRKCKN
jgi:hypothetical protein